MNQVGFGLLEILAALMVLAMSMLALTHGLLKAQEHALESLWLAHASLHAENIYERMLANPIGLQQGDYSQISKSSSVCNPCIPSEQAAKDLTEWQEQLQKTIPNSEGEIVLGNRQEIMVAWPSLWSDESEEFSEWIVYGGL